GLQVLRKRDDVLLDRVDIRLHRLGDIEHEHDIDRAALADAVKIDDLGLLAIFEHLDVLRAQISDRLTVGVGQAEIELYAGVVIKVLESWVSDRNIKCGGSSGRKAWQHRDR